MTCHVCADPTCIEEHFKMSENLCHTCIHNEDYISKPRGSLCDGCVGFKNYDSGSPHWTNQNAPSKRSSLDPVPTKPKNLKKYLPLAKEVANMSKDGSTKVGALAIGPSGEIRSSGWNGAPRGCHADEGGDARSIRPEKSFWFSHAELNAITNAARVGTPLEGCSMVVTHFPCMDCARAIVQAGVVKVVCPSPSGDFAERWKDSIARSRALFEECGVEFEEAPS